MQVTGAGNGIGKEIALRLAREGCNVAIADIDKKSAAKTASDIRELGVRSKEYHVICCIYKKYLFFCWSYNYDQIDVADYKQINQLQKEIENDLGFVDILVNNAAILPVLSIREGSEEEIERIVKVNITSHYYVRINNCIITLQILISFYL